MRLRPPEGRAPANRALTELAAAGGALAARAALVARSALVGLAVLAVVAATAFSAVRAGPTLAAEAHVASPASAPASVPAPSSAPALMEAAAALRGIDFTTAYDAALTRDPSALPVICAFLSDRTERTVLPQNSLDIEWPLGLDFVWGAFGPGGYPVLVEVAAGSSDPVMVESALIVLCKSEFPDALPVARRLAMEGETAPVRQAAVRLLGWHGRAMDWERLLLGLMSDDSDDISASLWAIHKSGDERAVSYAIPFCNYPDPWIRDEALSILALACTPESIEAMCRVCQERPDDASLDEFAFYTDAVLWMAGLDRETYCALAPADREQAIARTKGILYGPRPGAAQVSRDDALAMVAEWTEMGHIDCDGLDDLEYQIAGALVRDDIPLLQELKASICRNLSYEALRDVARVESIMQKVVRRDLAGKGP